MKKHYLLGIALFTAVSANSQITVDFEATTLAADTFNNGADLSGGFTYGFAHFSNYYDTTYHYNTGFSISNKTDVTTAGYLNQYSAITGSGFNSSNYAVFYPDGEISLTPTLIQNLLSVKITNTTYAALSMLNGDAVGKKFGDSVNAQGQVDGTNGEDFFILNIYGRTNSGDTTGMVEVVLADFRFADNTQDFVVQDWLNVDLQALNSSVGMVDYISFSFESSDNGAWGINTPTYFAMDDLEFIGATFGLDELNADLQVYPNPINDKLYVKGVEGELKIHDSFGKIVYAAHLANEALVDFTDFSSGVYFVSVENQSGIFTKKVIK